jgi:hypothetical protein
MFRKMQATAALVLTATAVFAGPDTTHTHAARPAPAVFEKVKALAGEWVAAEDNAMAKKGDLVARYSVTASGTAVVETIFPGSPHEMVTVYHADGDDVVLTHFCMSGNQPRMRAKAAKGTRLDFAFDGGTNLDPKRDRHMHSAWLELVAADEIRNEWTEHDGGKAVQSYQSRLLRKTR